MDILKALDIPASLAAILILVYWFLNDRRKDRAQQAARETAERELWDNHLSKSIEQQAKTATILEQVVRELRLLSDRLR